MFQLPSRLQKLVEIQNRLVVVSNKLSPFHKLNRLQKLNDLFSKFDSINQSPVAQFILISSNGYLEILDSKIDQSDEITELDRLEVLLEHHFEPYLKSYNLANIWLGAKFALNSKSNPDSLRHCLVSLRTLLEHTIEKILAPNDLLKDQDGFKKEFKKYVQDKTELSRVSIHRYKRIQFIFSQYDIPLLCESVDEDAAFIGELYGYLCNLHQLDVDLSPLNVRKLIIKTGVIVWLFIHLNELK